MKRKRKSGSKRIPQQKHFWRLCPLSEDVFSQKSVCISLARVWPIAAVSKQYRYFRDPLPRPTAAATPPEWFLEWHADFVKNRDIKDPRGEKLYVYQMERCRSQVYAYWEQVKAMYPQAFSGATLGTGGDGEGYYYPGVCAFTSEKKANARKGFYTGEGLVKLTGKILDYCPEGVVVKPSEVISRTDWTLDF